MSPTRDAQHAAAEAVKPADRPAWADQAQPRPPLPNPPSDPDAQRARDEREMLLEMLAQQQRIAQSGLVSAAMAHDVKNHIQAISGSAYLALDVDDPAEWRAALESIQRECRNVTDTMRSLLAFVRRQDAGAVRTFKVADAVAQALPLVQTFARKHFVDLNATLDCEGLVQGDARLATQAVVNLLTNAVLCFGERADGVVNVSVSMRGDAAARILVQDNGPGIPENVRTRLFRPFATSRVDDSGNGLGLFVVRQTVRKLGGCIRVRTSPRGTTFTIDLPVMMLRPGGLTPT